MYSFKSDLLYLKSDKRNHLNQPYIDVVYYMRTAENQAKEKYELKLPNQPCLENM